MTVLPSAESGPILEPCFYFGYAIAIPTTVLPTGGARIRHAYSRPLRAARRRVSSIVALRGPAPEMSLIVREACADPPPLPSERRRLARRLVKRHALSHDERRSAGHKDPERIVDCHLRIGLWHRANYFW